MNPFRFRVCALRSAVTALAVAGMLSACTSAGGSQAPSADCVPAHENLDLISAGTLTIGVSDMPPQSSTTGPDGYSGLDADIINGFAATECLSVTPISGASSAMVPGVEQHRWDTALGGWYRTEKRNEVVTMADPMYLDSLAIIAAEPETITSLEGKRVGTVDGYLYVPDLKSVYGDNLTLYPSVLELAQDLKAGRIDAAIDGAVSAPTTYGDAFVISVPDADPRVSATSVPGQCSLPFAKSNTTLLAAFNDYIAAIKLDGTLAELLTEYGIDPKLADTGAPRLL
ncbi:MAG: transporter substrate-binding domain-containing protein [Mycobacterium sp.]